MKTAHERLGEHCGRSAARPLRGVPLLSPLVSSLEDRDHWVNNGDASHLARLTREIVSFSDSWV